MNADNPNLMNQLLHSSPVPLVYWVADDKEDAENLAYHARAANYRVCILDSIEMLCGEMESHKPDVIILDMAFEEAQFTAADKTSHCAHMLHIPVIFLGTKSDVDARLAAVRAGAAHYFAKPVKPERLIARLDGVTRKPCENPYHIMLIDEDENRLVFLESALKDADVRVTAIGNCRDALDRMSRCQPELIALDADMTGITSSEFAAIIRQMEEYDHIPIAFLGTENVFRTRGTCLRTGDFLDRALPVKELILELQMRMVYARSQLEDRSRVQRALKDLQFMQNALDEHAIVTVTDLNGRIAYANPKFAKISGYSMQEVMGKTHRIVKSGLHPASMYEEMWHTISQGRVWQGTLTNRAKDGQLYDVYTSIIPELDDDGLPKRYLSIRTDVTAIRSLEQQKQVLQEQLLHAAKMESIGHLTSGIAHDFNNLLGGMLGYAEVGGELLARTNGPDRLKHYLAQIVAAGNRAKELINQMLIFSRFQPDSEEEEVPVTLLQPVLKEVIYLLRSSISRSIELNYRVEKADMRARIHPVQLHQILMNLAINARDAIGEYGRIDISLSRRSVSGACDSCHEVFEVDDYQQISVKDTGRGIHDQLRTKVFDPFFTTKEEGKGTGMGLSVVHGIVHKLGGHISMGNTDSGTIFRILLPAVTTDIKAAPGESVSLQGVQRGALSGLRIMVVDDERAMSSMLHELLSMHGAEVAIYNHPLKALEAFRYNPHCFDRVITVEAMPDISGLDMAKAMLFEKPGLPVLLCTGNSEHVNEKIAKQAGIAGFMHKPLEIPKLLQWLLEPLAA